MSFKKIRLGLEDIFELVIKDETGRKIEEWKCLKTDFPKVMKIISDKHGLNVKVIIKGTERRERDLDWIR